MRQKVRHTRIFLFAAATLLLFVHPVPKVSGQPNMANLSNRQNRRLPGSPPYGNSAPGANPFDTGEQNGEQDGNNPASVRDTTKRKPRKPLESYFFDDSTRMMPNFSWNVDMFRNKLNMTEIDTMLLHAQLDYPYLRQDVGDAFLGPLGAGTIPLNANRRPSYRDFEFAQILYSYGYDPQNVPFYNVKKPFTQLSYFSAGQKKYAEESLWVTHAQNISPSTGFNINYRNRGTRGIYAWQGSKDKNLSIAFNHTGKRYTVHAGYIYNGANIKENGGLVNDADLTKPQEDMNLPENIPVRMGNSSNASDNPRNIFKNNCYYLVQSMGFPLSRVSEDDFSIAGKSSIFIGNSLEYSRYYRKYTDALEGTLFNDPDNPDKKISYYDNWYTHPAITNDSIFESKLSARFFMQLQPWDRESIIGVIDGGIGVDNHLYYRFTPENYISGNNGEQNKNSWYLYGSAGGNFRRYMLWDANLKYIYAGYRSGDLDMAANLKLSAFVRGRPVTLTGGFSQSFSSPGYWVDNFFSNHFFWSNNFAKESATKLEAALSIPGFGLKAGMFQNLYVDKIYFGPDAKPAQASGSTSLTGIYVEENIPLWNLHFNHRVLLQLSSDSKVIPVPLASAWLSYFYEFNIVKNVLRVQLGIDGWYTTSYYGFGYNPATAQFYNQREKRLGEFPMIDIFLNAKWKRMRIITKLTHANQGLFGSGDTFNVLHYPLNARIFKLGISWSFYD